MYDPAIARWGCMDPMADATPHLTPFHYCYNSPIINIDPDGMFAYASALGMEDSQVNTEVNRVFGELYTAGTLNYGFEEEKPKKDDDNRTREQKILDNANSKVKDGYYTYENGKLKYHKDEIDVAATFNEAMKKATQPMGSTPTEF